MTADANHSSEHHEPGPGLNWGLVIVTYNRQSVLPRAVRHAATQNPPPSEIVIVDASDDWQETKAVVEEVVEQAGITPRFVYEAAEIRSISTQRNQAIKRAEADILFMIDDDSLMFPGCASEVMNIFNHPDAGEVVAMTTALANAAPTGNEDPVPPPAPKQIASTPRKPGVKRRVIEWMRGEYMPVYDTPPPTWNVPDALKTQFGCFERRQLHGARMIIRRAALTDEPFDETLNRYSYLEDSDIGYRIGRKGIILAAPRAKICHLADLSGRIPSKRTALISVTNAVYLTRRNAAKPNRNIRTIQKNALKRIPLELARDWAARRWSAPRARGIFAGLVHSRWIVNTPLSQIEQRYASFQEKLLDR
ncbi:MAG: glycosyltransferase family 2 protein [Phycisphaeraceae bacterium]